MNEAGKKAIILGATGAVGTPLLAELLNCAQYTQVHAFVRRPFKATSGHGDNGKLIEHVIDFEKLTDSHQQGTKSTEAEQLQSIQAEGVYITLGTTRALAGSFKAFERIDRDYVVAAAQAALGAQDDVRKKQRLVYCSSGGANNASYFPYLKSKGITEEQLAKAGYAECVLLRPGYLAEANRERTRTMEKAFGVFIMQIAPFIGNAIAIKVSQVGKAMLAAGLTGSAGLREQGIGQPLAGAAQDSTSAVVLDNGEIKRLAAQS